MRLETIRHMVAVHERCGTAVELLPSRQWYIDVLTDKDKYLAAGVSDTTQYPSSRQTSRT